jgi:hypothetical protein
LEDSVSLEDAPEGPCAEESQAQGETEQLIEDTEEAQQEEKVEEAEQAAQPQL